MRPEGTKGLFANCFRPLSRLMPAACAPRCPGTCASGCIIESASSCSRRASDAAILEQEHRESAFTAIRLHEAFSLRVLQDDWPWMKSEIALGLFAPTRTNQGCLAPWRCPSLAAPKQIPQPPKPNRRNTHLPQHRGSNSRPHKKSIITTPELAICCKRSTST